MFRLKTNGNIDTAQLKQFTIQRSSNYSNCDTINTEAQLAFGNFTRFVDPFLMAYVTVNSYLCIRYFYFRVIQPYPRRKSVRFQLRFASLRNPLSRLLAKCLRCIFFVCFAMSTLQRTGNFVASFNQCNNSRVNFPLK